MFLNTLTKLYPGANCSNRDIIDVLQVVLYVTLGHSVAKGKKRGKWGERGENRLLNKAFKHLQGYMQSVSII